MSKKTEETLMLHEAAECPQYWSNPIQGDVVDGVQREYHTNYGIPNTPSTIVRRRRLVRNRLVVAESGYDREGNLAWYQQFKNGLRHGESRGFFHKGGRLSHITPYKNGEFHGLDIYIDADGNLGSFHVYNEGEDIMRAYFHDVKYPYNPDGPMFTASQWKALGKKV